MSDEKMPVQVGSYKRGKIPRTMHMKAYEVYRRLYGEQQALIEGQCQGGFSVGELLAFLYAASFPPSEWRARVDEAFENMEGLA